MKKRPLDDQGLVHGLVHDHDHDLSLALAQDLNLALDRGLVLDRAQAPDLVLKAPEEVNVAVVEVRRVREVAVRAQQEARKVGAAVLRRAREPQQGVAQEALHGVPLIAQPKVDLAVEVDQEVAVTVGLAVEVVVTAISTSSALILKISSYICLQF